MKALSLIIVTLLALPCMASPVQESEVESSAPTSVTDSVSRAAATVLAQAINSTIANLTAMGVELDRTVFIETLNTALNGGETGFTPESADKYIQTQIMAQKVELADTVSIESQEAFIKEQSALPGAKVMPSGLVFITEQEGSGARPVDTDVVKVNYVGRLSDGTVFDDAKGSPIEFNVNKLIPGFTEGLKMMKAGGTYRLLIPYNLAYGEKGIGGIIPGYSALDFTINLIEIVPSSK